MVEPRPDQPGHAPRRRPAAPRPLGRRALEPSLRSRRRGARLPGSVRLARRQRAQAPAQARTRLRRGSPVPARLRDDRQPRRARPRADRARLHRHRRGRSSESGANGCALEPAARRRGAGPAGERSRRGVEADGRPGRARSTHTRVRQKPSLRRADPQVHGRPARRLVAALAVPGRLHRSAAARDRAAPLRRRAARSQRDKRPRARHRRRDARRGHLCRLPGNGRQPAPAVGPRGTPRSRAGRPRRQ